MSERPHRDERTRCRAVAVECSRACYQHRLLSTPAPRAAHAHGARCAGRQAHPAPLTSAGSLDRARGRHGSRCGSSPITAPTHRSRRHARRAPPAADLPGPGRRPVARTHARRQRRRDRVRQSRTRTRRRVRPASWRHEIAHPISPARGRGARELLVADALLTYLQAAATSHSSCTSASSSSTAARSPAEQLAAKFTRYAQLRDYTPARPRKHAASRPLWRAYYRTFPRRARRPRRPDTRARRRRIQRNRAAQHRPRPRAPRHRPHPS